MKELAYGLLDRALNFDADPNTVLGLTRMVASGTLVLAIGVGLVVRSYVRAGCKWPSERAGWA